MGNTCSHSIHLTPCRSSISPSFQIKDNEQKRVFRYGASETRLLPPPQLGQCLRMTENGNILLNGGTISGRKLHSLIEGESDPEVLRILEKRMARSDHFEQNTDHIYKSHSDPDIVHSLIDQENNGIMQEEKRHFHKSAAAVSPSKAKIKSRKKNRAPEPPQSLSTDQDKRSFHRSDSHLLKKKTHFIPNRKEWKTKHPAPPPPPLLFSERGKLETLQEIPGDGDSRSSGDIFRMKISGNRDVSKNIDNKSFFENTEKNHSIERREKNRVVVEKKANVTTENDSFQQTRNVVFNSKHITTKNHKLRSLSSLLCNNPENRRTFKEQIEAAARKHFQQIEVGKEVSKITEKTQINQEAIKQERGQHFESKENETECCSSKKFYFSEKLPSKGQNPDELMLTGAQSFRKSTEPRDSDKTNPVVTKAVVSHTFSASDQPEKVTKVIEFTKNEISNQLGYVRGHKSPFITHTNSEVQQEVLNKAALDPVDTSRYDRSLNNRSDESQRTKMKHVDYNSSTLPSNKSHSSDSDENNTDIRLQLKPTLPRKHLQIPKFSPSEAWKCLNIDRIIGHQDSDLSSNEEDINEERINQMNRSFAPRRSIVDLCDDSEISQDGERPVFVHEEGDEPQINKNQRPEVLGSSSPEMSATNRQTWIPQNDLDDSETGSINNCESNQKQKYSSENMLTQAKLTLPSSMFGGFQSLPMPNDNNGINSSSFNKGKNGRCKKKDKDVTTQHFNSLRNIKKAFRFGNKNISDEAYSRLDPNWSLSRSIPNNIYKIHETENIGLRKSKSGSIFPSSHEERNDNTDAFSKQTQEMQSFLLQDKGPMMYLPKCASSRSFSELNRECELNPSTTKVQPRRKDKKKFAFDSTIRKHERQNLELKLSRQAAMKEKEREKEIKLMNKVEDEFRKQRDKEKISIRYQLRILNMEENKDGSFLEKQHTIGQFLNKNSTKNGGDVFIGDSNTTFGESDQKDSAYTSENSSPQTTSSPVEKSQNQPQVDQWNRTTGMSKWLRRQRQASDSPEKPFSPPRPEPEGARSSGDECKQCNEYQCQQSTICQSLAKPAKNKNVAKNREKKNVHEKTVRQDKVNNLCDNNAPIEYDSTNRKRYDWTSNLKERSVQPCSSENTTRQAIESINQEKHVVLNASVINRRHVKDCQFSQQLHNREDKEFAQYKESRLLCALTDLLPESTRNSDYYRWRMRLRRKSFDDVESTSDDASSSASEGQNILRESSKQTKYLKNDWLLDNNLPFFSDYQRKSEGKPQTYIKQEAFADYDVLSKPDLSLVLTQPFNPCKEYRPVPFSSLPQSPKKVEL